MYIVKQIKRLSLSLSLFNLTILPIPLGSLQYFNFILSFIQQ